MYLQGVLLVITAFIHYLQQGGGVPATRSRSLGGEVLASDHTTATHEGYALQQGAGVRECEALLGPGTRTPPCAEELARGLLLTHFTRATRATPYPRYPLYAGNRPLEAALCRKPTP